MRLTLLLCALIAGCGGSPTDSPIEAPIKVVSNAKVGDPFVYADGDWKYPDHTAKWVIRGTSENDDFMPMPTRWYLPAGQINGRDWWSVANTPAGVINHASPSEAAYNGSFINDAFTQSVYVKDKPILDVDVDVTAFTGEKVRATVGISLRFPNGSEFYVERNIRRTDSFDLCDGYLDRCQGYVYYFPPATGSIDVRALLLKLLPEDVVDTMRIAGIYVGSEIYGKGTVDLLIKSYKVTQ